MEQVKNTSVPQKIATTHPMKLRKAVQTGPGQGLDGSRVGRVKGWTGQWLDGLVMVKWVKGWTCPVCVASVWGHVFLSSVSQSHCPTFVAIVILTAVTTAATAPIDSPPRLALI